MGNLSAIERKGFGQSAQSSKSFIKLQGAKEIADMFGKLSKDIGIKQDLLWVRLWKKIAKPAMMDAKGLAPKLGDSKKSSPLTVVRGVTYPPDHSKRITKGTLKESIGFFRTRDSKNHLGIYLGPRLKGKFKKNKGGYYGAWLEDGDTTMFFGKYKGRATKFMDPAWNRNKISMTKNAFKGAEDIAAKAIKAHARKLKKYGTLGA
jgi:hypothetical protein